MEVMIKRVYRPNGEYPLHNRDKFLKTVKGITCELGLIDYDWVSLRRVLKEHQQYYKENPKTTKYTAEQIKAGVEKLLKLGYVNKRVL